MATLYIDGLENFINNDVKLDPLHKNSPIKAHYGEITLAAELAVNDEILLPKIPEGCRIVDAWVQSPSLGITGILDLGLKAYTDKEGNAIAEDQNSLVNQVDAGGAAVLGKTSLTSIALGKVVGRGGVQPFLKCTEASGAGTGLVVKACIMYMED